METEGEARYFNGTMDLPVEIHITATWISFLFKIKGLRMRKIIPIVLAFFFISAFLN
jgi:hypothetical protein